MKYYSAALIFLTVTFSIFLCALVGFYPAALVAPARNSGLKPHIIWARSVRRVSQTTLIYYERAFGNASSTFAITPLTINEVKSKSVEALINQTFIADAARRAATDAEIQIFIEEKLARSNTAPHFKTAVSLLYGLDSAGFIELIARPEAEKEMLQKKKGWDDAALEHWLAEEKRRAKIVKF